MSGLIPVDFCLDNEKIVSMRLECIPRVGELISFKNTDEQVSAYVVSGVGHIFEETSYNSEELLSAAKYHVDIILERLEDYGINNN